MPRQSPSIRTRRLSGHGPSQTPANPRAESHVFNGEETEVSHIEDVADSSNAIEVEHIEDIFTVENTTLTAAEAEAEGLHQENEEDDGMPSPPYEYEFQSEALPSYEASHQDHLVALGPEYDALGEDPDPDYVPQRRRERLLVRETGSRATRTPRRRCSSRRPRPEEQVGRK